MVFTGSVNNNRIGLILVYYRKQLIPHARVQSVQILLRVEIVQIAIDGWISETFLLLLPTGLSRR